MKQQVRVVTIVLWVAGVAHLVIGVAGLGFPTWFFETVPPWPPLHVGQIQIGAVFDLTMATVYLGATTDLDRYLPLVVPAGVVAEWGHASVRIGHVLIGDNPADDRALPALMLLLGAMLLAAGLRTRRARGSARASDNDGVDTG